MNKIIKSTLLAMLLSSSLMAEVVFDLGAQQLSNAQDGIYKVSSYDVGKSIIATGMISNKGTYQPKIANRGSMSVQIKEPKPNWGVTFSMYCYLYNDGCGVTLLSKSGASINISLNYHYLSIDGNQTTSNQFKFNTDVYGSIQQIQNSDNISININGFQNIITKPNFKLAHIDIGLSGIEHSNGYRLDSINSLAISTSDN
jgi:hypothetical protein